jgi:hypothetical protein
VRLKQANRLSKAQSLACWDDSPILRKIDRALVNTEWEARFPIFEALFLPAGVSNHPPMVIKLADLPKSKGLTKKREVSIYYEVNGNDIFLY